MAVQQRRVSKSRKGMRRSHHALDIPLICSCTNCGEQKQPHRVCNACGYYNGKQIISK